MESSHCYSSSSSATTLFLFLFLLTGLSAASVSTFISDDIFGSRATTGRSLLQVKQGCPVYFEIQNYTIITSKCKGPQYPADLCCSAFKKFACPFAKDLNDLSNDCAATMFSYINLHGNYPAGLFASLCRDGKNGLECPASPPTQSVKISGGKVMCTPSLLLMLTVGFLFLLSTNVISSHVLSLSC